MATATQETIVEMVFDPSMVDGVDQETVERNDAEFPTIQWHRGDPKLKKVGGMDWMGGWFMSEAGAPADMTEHGWEKVTWSHDSENETDGYYIRDLTVAVIRDRRRWEVTEGKKRAIFAWNDYDNAVKAGRASGRSHTLVLIKGLEELGPFVLTLRGMAAVHLYNKKNSPRSAIGTFDAIVVRAANDQVKKSGRKGLMPRRAFWLTVGPTRDAKGLPVFIVVGSGSDTSHMVVPMVLDLPEKSDQVKLNQFFVGNELLTRTSELWREVEAWATAWDDIKPGSVDNPDDKITPAPADAADKITEDVAEQMGF